MDRSSVQSSALQRLPGPMHAALRLLDGLWNFVLDTVATVITGYFILAAGILYWIVAATGALSSWILPRSLIARHPLAWLVASTLACATLTQTVPGFFPDYSNWRQALLEVGVWVALGVVARSYLIYTEAPETFEGIKASIAERPLERWLATMLNHPVDAVFTRVWVANTVLMLPLTTLLILPQTINYLVIVAYATMLMLSQFPQEVVEHQDIHTRVFSPKVGATPRERRILGALQFYFEYIFALLTARVPGFYRVQHVYVHHVEDNGPLDTQTTEPYDRTSFIDFSRHSAWQGVDLVTGGLLIKYLMKKGKKRQLNEIIRGLAIWWAFILAVAVFNPLGALYLFFTRFLGGPFITLITFYQHGLVDPHDPDSVAGHTTDYVQAEHGNLGFDYHVEHHQKPARHWSHYYSEYNKLTAKNGGHPAIVMQKDQFGPLAFMAALWRKDYGEIAKYAHVGEVPRDTQDMRRIVGERVRPVGMPEPAGILAAIDNGVSRAMAAAIPKHFVV